MTLDAVKRMSSGAELEAATAYLSASSLAADYH